MLYIIVSIAIYGVTFFVLFGVLGKKNISVHHQLSENLKAAENEEEQKKEILSRLASMSLGLIGKEDFQQLVGEMETLEETIRAEKGRLTITEAELEAVDTRLRELEELKRELEVSNIDAVKELEMLRAQERDMKGQNEALKAQLENSMEQLEMLLDMLAHSAAAVQRLNAAKNELLDTEKKCVYYQEQIALINSKYMALKKAYDALDIEYAQLYEKQQSAESSATQENA